eukprot:m.52780 g.52780  ORF g.52780 m.52780 type:complete len:122 (-) comp15429_c0_seq2:143-508(-)
MHQLPRYSCQLGLFANKWSEIDVRHCQHYFSRCLKTQYINSIGFSNIDIGRKLYTASCWQHDTSVTSYWTAVPSEARVTLHRTASPMQPRPIVLFCRKHNIDTFCRERNAMSIGKSPVQPR